METNTPFPVCARIRAKSVMGLLSSLIFGAVCLNSSVDAIAWFERYGENLFYAIMMVTFTVFFAGLLLYSLLTLKERVYMVTCPACGKQTAFPVGAAAANCVVCQKRLVMNGNEIKAID